MLPPHPVGPLSGQWPVEWSHSGYETMKGHVIIRCNKSGDDDDLNLVTPNGGDNIAATAPRGRSELKTSGCVILVRRRR